jgi:segregation and condensation protein A
MRLMSMQEALERLRRLLRVVPDWAVLTRFLPPGLDPGLPTRAGVASMLVAGLELAKDGRLELRQEEPFGPIWVKPAARAPEEGTA